MSRTNKICPGHPSVQQHEAEEANITPEQMNTATQAARDAFKQVFGDAAMQEAIQEPKKKEEPKKKDE